MGLIIFINLLFDIYFVMLLVRILSSWFPEITKYRFFQFIAYYTDPYLNIFRRFIPPLGMFDLSPIVAFLALQLFQKLFISLLIAIIFS
jgi:YggT family protein